MSKKLVIVESPAKAKTLGKILGRSYTLKASLGHVRDLPRGQIGVHACTDITGFALLGHGYETAEKSGVQLRFYLDKLPFLDGAMDYAEQWLFPAGTCSNERAYQHGVTFAPSVSEEMQQLLYTPETSGGLLVSVAPEKAEALRSLFAEEGHPCWIIGEVVEGEGVQVLV